ncbi:hypothetical protein BU16DRAFT_532107 [Lophium mytilinum]|uniref:Uncharacterized protein n=1 Tax=Lophium mytilinum TaxID=390894 RepID=A0A6A6QAW0_9PEZI|nr:hypothetical protein BU16DRAFT_532107 [Lophium mytilinum]
MELSALGSHAREHHHTPPLPPALDPRLHSMVRDHSLILHHTPKNPPICVLEP